MTTGQLPITRIERAHHLLRRLDRLTHRGPRQVRNSLKSWCYHILRWSQRIGVSIVPNHYYLPIRDLRAIERTRSEWAIPVPSNERNIPSIAQQTEWLRAALDSTTPEELHRADASHGHALLTQAGPGYNRWDAQVLYAFVSHYRPNKIVEVGAGCSTEIMQQAAAQVDSTLDHTCIDPNPAEWLRTSAVTLIPRRVQACSLEIFDELDAGDLLFIDSSHVVATGSDAVYLITRVIPSLRPGVIVHFHDIYFPYLFNHHVTTTVFDWQESALLYAYCLGNDAFALECSLSWINHEAPHVLAELLFDYAPALTSDGLLENPPWKLDCSAPPVSAYFRVI